MKEEQINVKEEAMEFQKGLHDEETFPHDMKPEAQDHSESFSSVLDDLNSWKIFGGHLAKRVKTLEKEKMKLEEQQMDKNQLISRLEKEKEALTNQLKQTGGLTTASPGTTAAKPGAGFGSSPAPAGMKPRRIP